MNRDRQISGANTKESTRAVISRDGTKSSYRTFGSGPSMIAILGVLSTAANYALFASALGRNYTVHVIERRGRGLSGPQVEDYGIAKECEDIAALREATQSTLLFGHS